MTSRFLIVVALSAAVLGSAQSCASATVQTPPSDGAAEPAVSVQESRTLAPRMDLQCTPVNAEDESSCAAQGSGYRYGPPPFNNGPARASEEALARDEAAYAAQVESGTLPCECVPTGIIPFQSPPR
jgi:hypothetical protein